MSITYVNCSIKLIKPPDFELIKKAWTLSRPKETDPDLNQILAIDAPINELTDIVLEFHVPILIREIICSLRDHRVWSQTSRVQDLTEWEVWSGIGLSPIVLTGSVNDLYKCMMKAKESKSDQDDYRMYLPLCYMTKFTASFSLRTYMKLASYFRALQIEFYKKDPIERLFQEVYSELISWHYDFEIVYNLIKSGSVKFDELCPIPEYGYGDGLIGNMVSAGLEVSIALRAQVVRHRMFLVSDSLRDFFSIEGLYKPISSPIALQITTTYEIAKSIITKRQCWISQTDIWEPIIIQMNAAVTDQDSFKPLLPCDDGECPYKRDNQLRIEGKDPGVPCPKYALMYRISMKKVDYDRAYIYSSKRSTHNFWKDLLNDVDNMELVK